MIDSLRARGSIILAVGEHPDTLQRKIGLYLLLPARHAFHADDLVVKTLLLAALVPNVPALRGLTAGRLAALNHGSIASLIPGQDRKVVAKTLRELAGEFGEIRVSGTDDPDVELALLGVDTSAILAKVMTDDSDAARRRLVKTLLWEELGVGDDGAFSTTKHIVWKGTDRTVELLFANVRDRQNASGQFAPDMPDALRVVIDHPFDEGNHGPADDRNRVMELRERLDRPHTLVWLPSFLSTDRMADLGDLVRITHLLEHRDRLDDLTPDLTTRDRDNARAQLDNRRAALADRLVTALKRAYGVAGPDDADLGARAEDHILALDSRLEIKPSPGHGLGVALEQMCRRLLDHLFPKHPDFDPQGKRQVCRRSELTTVLNAVERAAQDKGGRLEVTGAELPVLRRIANPLEIATVGEVFVLRDDWKLLIERSAAQAGPTDELTVGDVARWVRDAEPGLPALIVDLLVACFAVQSNRAWVRGGRQIPPPELGRLASEMVLRRQALPSEEEFQRAGDRAISVFGLGRQPVPTARSVQVLAEQVRERARLLLPTAEALVQQLERHATALGLDDTAPRLVTARTAAELLNRLTGLGNDPTALLKALAAQKLPREGEIYQAGLRTAQELTDALSRVKWQILDQLPALAKRSEARAESARAILDRLRSAARHDEHEVPLKAPLAEAERQAIALIIEPEPEPEPGLEPSPSKRVTRRVAASDIAAVAQELCTHADERTGATFEITWRVVDEK